MQLLSVEQARQMLGLGRTAFYELLRSGALPAKKHGRRTLIDLQDVEQFGSQMPPYTRIEKHPPDDDKQ